MSRWYKMSVTSLAPLSGDRGGTAQAHHRPIVAVDIAICTFRRNSVFDTLDSIARQAVPGGITLSVIVADNDHHPLLAEQLQAAARRTGLVIRYVHAPACNISIARNACLSAATGDVLILIDDDELADPDWLMDLLETTKRNQAGVVFGPARAIYPDDSPEWMRCNDFHSNIPAANRGVVETGYSSNALLDLRLPQIRRARFNEAFGRTGGEDTDFFFRLHRAGVPMTISHGAVVREPVAPSRMSFRWILHRRYSAGRIYGHCAMIGASMSMTGLAVSSSLVKSGVCGVCAAAFALAPRRAAFWIMRSSFHFGVAAGALRAPRREVYGTE